jgi:alpha-L-fucosidase
MKTRVFLFSIMLLCSGAMFSQNKVLLMNGGSDYVSLPSLNITTNNLTLEAWVYSDVIQKSYVGIQVFNGFRCGMMVRENNELGYMWEDTNGERWSWSSGLKVPVNQWVHVALVVTPTRATVFLNADSVTQVKNCAANLIGESKLGTDPTNTTKLWQGKMYDVRVWNKALTKSQIVSNWDAILTGTESGLVANWQYNGDANDKTANAFNGTLTGCTFLENFTRLTPLQYKMCSAFQSNISNVKPGTKAANILGLKIDLSGVITPLTLSNIQVNLNGTTQLADLTKLTLYSTGSSNLFGTAKAIGTVNPATGTIDIPVSVQLSASSNYLWLAADIDSLAPIGNLIDAECLSVTVNGTQYLPTITAPVGNRTISNIPSPPAPVGAIPSAIQLEWQKKDMYAFVHFGINTYYDQEWGTPGVVYDAKMFQPTKLNTGQWVKTFQAAGLKGLVFVAKHHDGFCNWPSKLTKYSLAASSWRGGKGDVVKEVADSCAKYGMPLGLYVSPADMNCPSFATGVAYDDYFTAQLREMYNTYMPKKDGFETWFDGAEPIPNKRQDYDFKRYFNVVDSLSPNSVVFQGLDTTKRSIRWIGNESGIGRANWCSINSVTKEESEFGDVWNPLESDVSIRPGWFYHSSQDNQVKTIEQLLTIYYSTAGNNSNLILNIPPNKEGLIHKNDSTILVRFGAAIARTFATDFAASKVATATNFRGGNATYAASNLTDGNPDTYWATDDNVITPSVVIDFGVNKTFDKILLQEYTALGQRVEAFTVDAWNGVKWTTIVNETTIGYRRIVSFTSVTASKIRVNITKSRACPVISTIGVFKSPLLIADPVITRTLAGKVSITCSTSVAKIYFTLDGTEPTTASTLYSGSFDLLNGGTVRAKAFAQDEASSTVGKAYGLCKQNWKILSFDSQQDATTDAATNAIDENTSTIWHTAWSPLKAQPHTISIDLGGVYPISGFGYTPRQDGISNGIVFNYSIYMPTSAAVWGTAVLTTQFDNIKNNPIQQVKFLPSVNTSQYFGFKSLSEVNSNGFTSAAEFDVFVKVANVPGVSDQSFIVDPVTSKPGSSIGIIAIDGTAMNQTLIYSIVSSSVVGAVSVNALTGAISVADTALLKKVVFPITLQVRLSDSSDPKSGNLFTVTINSGISKLQTIDASLCKIYPNPNKGSFVVELPATNYSGTMKFNLMDSSGKCLQTIQQQENSKCTFDRIPKGVYVLRVMQQDNVVLSSKVVVN